MSQNRGEFLVAMLCELMKVARSSYYAYVNRELRPSSKRQQRHADLLEKTKVIFEASKRRYGRARVHKALLLHGERCSLGRVKRLMRHSGLYAVSGRKFKPKQARAGKPETKNLLLEQNICPTAINQVRKVPRGPFSIVTLARA